MKLILKRCVSSFAISCVCGAIVNLLIEVIVRSVTGMENFSPLTAEFISLFPSESIAVEVNILLYGVIGAGFSAMMFIYDQDRIGFVIQNLIYYVLTALVWVPIVVFVWQINKYSEALICTLMGFLGTYIIMTVVGYKVTKKDIEEVNLLLGVE